MFVISSEFLTVQEKDFLSDNIDDSDDNDDYDDDSNDKKQLQQ